MQAIVDEIAPSVGDASPRMINEMDGEELERYVDDVARRNVLRTAAVITQRSAVIRRAVAEGRLKVAAAMYDVKTGEIEFLTDSVDPAPATVATSR